MKNLIRNIKNNKQYNRTNNVMRKTILNIVFSAIATTGIAAGYQVQSPDGRLTLTAGTRSGRPYYSMSCGAETVISESFLGMTLAEADLSTDFAVRKITRSSKDETWTQVWGEDETVRNNYNELTLHLRRKSGRRLAMDIVFRVFNDGIGFRYVIPEQKQLSGITVMEENTEFALPQESMAWSIPANHANFYEGIYKRSAVAEKDTVCTPLTVECGDSLYLAIHEAALTDYASLTLTPRKSSTLRAALVPWQSGVKVYGGRSLVSPWRTVIVGRTPGELITSRLMLNLNEPCRIEDTSWIEPGRYIGIWWSIHKKKNTWEMGAKHGATTANMRRYIDFAARHGFSGVLAEGWNYGWGNGETVTFRRNYPDYGIDSLAAYAREKGVRLIAHTETWGNARLLESEMDSAFAWFNRLGINAVKTGYVNPKLDNRELQHSQYGVRHYRKVIETAARHHLMIDNHEPVMPTGLQRTYPNLMTQEGVRGQEYNAWSADGGNPPSHTATLPFTRGLAGPTDFTPAIFHYGDEVVQGTHPQSTLAKQLAEFVVIYSPLQMAADMIENYEYQPALSFIESCPTTWSKTIVPNGEIGRYVTIARKERGGDTWFVGSLTDETARDITLSLDFLDAGATYRAVIYEDGPGADYQDNPYPMTIRRERVTNTSTLSLKLARSGGAAIRIEKE